MVELVLEQSCDNATDRPDDPCATGDTHHGSSLASTLLEQTTAGRMSSGNGFATALRDLPTFAGSVQPNHTLPLRPMPPPPRRRSNAVAYSAQGSQVQSKVGPRFKIDSNSSVFFSQNEPLKSQRSVELEEQVDDKKDDGKDSPEDVSDKTPQKQYLDLPILEPISDEESTDNPESPRNGAAEISADRSSNTTTDSPSTKKQRCSPPRAQILEDIVVEDSAPSKMVPPLRLKKIHLHREKTLTAARPQDKALLRICTEDEDSNSVGSPNYCIIESDREANGGALNGAEIMGSDRAACNNDLNTPKSIEIVIPSVPELGIKETRTDRIDLSQDTSPTINPYLVWKGTMLGKNNTPNPDLLPTQEHQEISKLSPRKSDSEGQQQQSQPQQSQLQKQLQSQSQSQSSIIQSSIQPKSLTQSQAQSQSQPQLQTQSQQQSLPKLPPQSQLKPQSESQLKLELKSERLKRPVEALVRSRREAMQQLQQELELKSRSEPPEKRVPESQIQSQSELKFCLESPVPPKLKLQSRFKSKFLTDKLLNEQGELLKQFHRELQQHRDYKLPVIKAQSKSEPESKQEKQELQSQENERSSENIILSFDCFQNKDVTKDFTKKSTANGSSRKYIKYWKSCKLGMRTKIRLLRARAIDMRHKLKDALDGTRESFKRTILKGKVDLCDFQINDFSNLLRRLNDVNEPVGLELFCVHLDDIIRSLLALQSFDQETQYIINHQFASISLEETPKEAAPEARRTRHEPQRRTSADEHRRFAEEATVENQLQNENELENNDESQNLVIIEEGPGTNGSEFIIDEPSTCHRYNSVIRVYGSVNKRPSPAPKTSDMSPKIASPTLELIQKQSPQQQLDGFPAIPRELEVQRRLSPAAETITSAARSPAPSVSVRALAPIVTSPTVYVTAADTRSVNQSVTVHPTASIQSTAIQPTSALPTTIESTIAQSTIVQSKTAKPSVAHSTIAQSMVVQSAIIEPATGNPTISQSTITKPLIAPPKLTVNQTDAAQSTIIQPITAQSTVLQQTRSVIVEPVSRPPNNQYQQTAIVKPATPSPRNYSSFLIEELVPNNNPPSTTVMGTIIYPQRSPETLNQKALPNSPREALMAANVPGTWTEGHKEILSNGSITITEVTTNGHYRFSPQQHKQSNESVTITEVTTNGHYQSPLRAQFQTQQQVLQRLHFDKVDMRELSREEKKISEYAKVANKRPSMPDLTSDNVKEDKKKRRRVSDIQMHWPMAYNALQLHEQQQQVQQHQHQHQQLHQHHHQQQRLQQQQLQQQQQQHHQLQQQRQQQLQQQQLQQQQLQQLQQKQLQKQQQLQLQHHQLKQQQLQQVEQQQPSKSRPNSSGSSSTSAPYQQVPQSHIYQHVQDGRLWNPVEIIPPNSKPSYNDQQSVSQQQQPQLYRALQADKPVIVGHPEYAITMHRNSDSTTNPELKLPKINVPSPTSQRSPSAISTPKNSVEPIKPVVVSPPLSSVEILEPSPKSNDESKRFRSFGFWISEIIKKPPADDSPAEEKRSENRTTPSSEALCLVNDSQVQRDLTMFKPSDAIPSVVATNNYAGSSNNNISNMPMPDRWTSASSVAEQQQQQPTRPFQQVQLPTAAPPTLTRHSQGLNYYQSTSPAANISTLSYSKYPRSAAAAAITQQMEMMQRPQMLGYNNPYSYNPMMYPGEVMQPSQARMQNLMSMQNGAVASMQQNVATMPMSDKQLAQMQYPSSNHNQRYYSNPPDPRMQAYTNMYQRRQSGYPGVEQYGADQLHYTKLLAAQAAMARESNREEQKQQVKTSERGRSAYKNNGIYSMQSAVATSTRNGPMMGSNSTTTGSLYPPPNNDTILPPPPPPPTPSVTHSGLLNHQLPPSRRDCQTPNLGEVSRSHAPQRCFNCGVPGSRFECLGCGSAYYCNESCQVQHWNVHVRQCPKMMPQLKKVA